MFPDWDEAAWDCVFLNWDEAAWDCVFQECDEAAWDRIIPDWDEASWDCMFLAWDEIKLPESSTDTLHVGDATFSVDAERGPAASGRSGTLLPSGRLLIIIGKSHRNPSKFDS